MTKKIDLNPLGKVIIEKEESEELPKGLFVRLVRLVRLVVKLVKEVLTSSIPDENHSFSPNITRKFESEVNQTLEKAHKRWRANHGGGFPL